MIAKVIRCLKATTAVAVVVLGAQNVAAQDYPDKAVTNIVPFNAGGESDVTARFQQPYFKELTGQDMIIQYLPGAGGAQAWAQLNKMPADGYTIMGANLPHIVMQPMLQNPGYTTDDVAVVYFFHFTPNALIVRADSPYQSLQEVIDAAKANPGGITAGGTGTNSANHIANQVFQNETDVELTYIPYSGSGATESAMLAGEIDVLWNYTTVAAKQGDNVRVLAIATEERHSLFPDVPTFKELGYDMVGGAYRGIAMPKDAPEDMKMAVSDIIGQINSNPEFVAQMQEAGYQLIDISYDKMADFMAEQKEIYGQIAEELQAAN